MKHLDNPLFWILVCLFSFAAFIPLNKWWRGLDNESATIRNRTDYEKVATRKYAAPVV